MRRCARNLVPLRRKTPVCSVYWSATRHDDLSDGNQPCIAAVPAGAGIHRNHRRRMRGTNLFAVGADRPDFARTRASRGFADGNRRTEHQAAHLTKAAGAIFRSACETGERGRIFHERLSERIDCAEGRELDTRVQRLRNGTTAEYEAARDSFTAGGNGGCDWNEPDTARHDYCERTVGCGDWIIEEPGRITAVRCGVGGNADAAEPERSLLQISSDGCLCSKTLNRHSRSAVSASEESAFGCRLPLAC